MSLYDVLGNIITGPEFADNMVFSYGRDSASGTNYTMIRIFQTKKDGTKQYPFSRTPTTSSTSSENYSALEVANNEGWALTVNAWGVFSNGIVIENGIVKRNTVSTYHAGALPLTIDSNGNLSYASADADADTLVANGIVSAVPGFCPIIVDYNTASLPTIGNADHLYTDRAQREIIGQFGNGDYAIITCEGRDYDNSAGWTMAEAQAVCQSIGLKFAFNMDGGGSTEIVLGKKQINTIYENVTGRKCQTFIVFNGTDQYFIPSEQ